MNHRVGVGFAGAQEDAEKVQLDDGRILVLEYNLTRPTGSKNNQFHKSQVLAGIRSDGRLSTMSSEADALIDRLSLAPHPEGGYFRQTWVADAPAGQRPAGTAILFLLPAGDRSHWHRVDADEIWLWHAGAPIELAISATDAGPVHRHILGSDVLAGQSPQLIVPTHHWQAARSLGDYTLVSCTVSPGFRFEGFELAPPDFDIG